MMQNSEIPSTLYILVLAESGGVPTPVVVAPVVSTPVVIAVTISRPIVIDPGSRVAVCSRMSVVGCWTPIISGSQIQRRYGIWHQQPEILGLDPLEELASKKL